MYERYKKVAMYKKISKTFQQHINLYQNPTEIKFFIGYVQSLERVSKNGLMLKCYKANDSSKTWFYYIILPKIFSQIITDDIIEKINSVNDILFMYSSGTLNYCTLTELKNTSFPICKLNHNFMLIKIKVSDINLEGVDPITTFQRNSINRKALKNRNINNKRCPEHGRLI